MMSKLMGRTYEPPPKWFTITKKLFNIVINFIIAILMILGRRADDQTLLIIKLCQSFLMEVIDSLMVNSNEYIPIPPELKEKIEVAEEKEKAKEDAIE